MGVVVEINTWERKWISASKIKLAEVTCGSESNTAVERSRLDVTASKLKINKVWLVPYFFLPRVAADSNVFVGSDCYLFISCLVFVLCSKLKSILMLYGSIL